MTRAYTRRSEFTRRNVPPELRDCMSWDPVDTSQLSDDDRVQFQNLQVAANEYLQGRPVKKWLGFAGVTHGEFLRKLNRALLRTATGGIVGWVGFLKHAVRLPYRRTKSTSGKNPKGLAGALHSCFNRVDRLEATLLAAILKRPSYAPHEARIGKNDLHRLFLTLCKEGGLGSADWPFNTRWEGRRSIARFFDEALQRFYAQGVRSRAGESAASKLRTGTGHPRLMRPEFPYDLVEMDAHALHMIGSVGLPLPDGMIEYVPIERIQLLLIADARSGLILGYVAVIRRECTSDDILDVVHAVLSPWQARSLCLSVHQYDEGAGLPSGVVDGIANCGFAMLCVDNALINWSNVIFDRVVPRIGCAVNWGPVNSWMRRPLVECIFSALERLGFCRMPSSTGSHPKDARRDRAERHARELKIHFDIVLDLIDLEITRFNIQSSEGRFGVKRMDVLRQYLLRPELGFMAPTLPVADAQHPDLDVTVDISYVRAKNENPYTKFCRTRYRSPGLTHAVDLIDHQIVRHIKRSNVRMIEAYRLNGQRIGTLTAEWPWSEYDTTLELKRQIFRLVDDGRISAQHNVDYVRDGLNLIHAQARADARRKGRLVSRAGTMLAREQQQRGPASGGPGTVEPPPPARELPSAPKIRDPHTPRIRHRV